MKYLIGVGLVASAVLAGIGNQQWGWFLFMTFLMWFGINL